MLFLLLNSVYDADLEREKPIKTSQGQRKKRETLGKSEGGKSRSARIAWKKNRRSHYNPVKFREKTLQKTYEELGATSGVLNKGRETT